MSTTDPSNLTIITTTGDTLPPVLAQKGFSAGHFTNGTYMPPSALIVPTVLAGFQHAADRETVAGIPLIIAVNSNASMSAIMDKKGAPPEERSRVEDQTIRAHKVAIPLAWQNPDRRILVVYYDEETPNALYKALNTSGLHMHTLFKWGYGTDPKSGVIEGAEFFQKTIGHPLPNDIKPICADITRRTDQQGKVAVVDLRTEIGKHGLPYISRDNECLFPLAAALSAYNPSRPSPPASNGGLNDLKPHG